MKPGRLAMGAALAASALGAAPADAALPMKFWVEYTATPTGTVAFACHNVGVWTAGANTHTAHATSVSCAFNGHESARVTSGGWHATSAGVANAAFGSTVDVCVSAAVVYFFPNMQNYSLDVCAPVVVAPAGVVYL